MSYVHLSVSKVEKIYIMSIVIILFVGPVCRIFGVNCAQVWQFQYQIRFDGSAMHKATHKLDKFRRGHLLPEKFPFIPFLFCQPTFIVLMHYLIKGRIAANLFLTRFDNIHLLYLVWPKKKMQKAPESTVFLHLYKIYVLNTSRLILV